MKIKRQLSLIITAIFLMTIIFNTATMQNTSAEIVGDRIIRVATTTWVNGSGTKSQNLQNIFINIQDAAKCNPDIIVLCEGSYSLANWSPFFETVPGPFTNALSAKAILYNTYIVANMYEDGQDGHKYNTNVLINKQGNIVGKYRKLRLPPSETMAPYGMIAGTEPKVFDTEFGKLAMEICFDIDIRFPEVTKMHAELGAELILVSSMGDYTHAAVEFARQNNIFMVTSVRDQIWNDPYPVSAIIANDGRIINGVNLPNGTVPKSCYADINLSNKTWSVPDQTNKYPNTTPPPIRKPIPFTNITASDSIPGTNPQSLADGSIDNIIAGPDKGHPYWSSNKKEPVLIFDMGSLKKVGSIGIVQYDVFEQEDYFKIYFSQDGASYVEYTKGLNYASRLLRDFNTGSSISVKCYCANIFPGYKYITISPPLDTRYIKIVGYGNNTALYKYTNLTEVTAFEPLGPQPSYTPFPTAITTKTPVPTPTPTPTPAPTLTPTPMTTSTVTPTATVTATATATSIPTLTATQTSTPTFEPTPAYQFIDVSENHWAKNQIYSLAAKGIIEGYLNEDGTYSYRPDDNIKRSEFIKILTCAFDVYDPDSIYDTFTDVKKEDWFYAYVASAVEEELTIGISADAFGSNQTMSREDLVTFIQRALVKYKGYILPSEEQINISLSRFADADIIQAYAKPALALLVENEIISGYIMEENIYFRPQNNATRAEVAIIADKSLKLEDLNFTRLLHYQLSHLLNRHP